MNIDFDQPQFLLLALLAIPLLIIGWRALALADHLRRAVILSIRALLLLTFAFILAGPRMIREHDQLTVIGLLDISGSVQRFGGSDLRLTIDDLRLSSDPGDEWSASQSSIVNRRSSIIEHLRQWFRTAAAVKAPEDRFGLIVFDGQAIAVSAPAKSDYVDDNLDAPIAPEMGTNIEDAVRLGLAMFPPDTARRFVLVTDGNETVGNVMEAIGRFTGTDLRLEGDADSKSSIVNRQSSIPIDVLPIIYHVSRDVQVVRLEAPPSAQPGQTVTVRMVLESTAPAAGRLTLRREGEPIDLNGDQSGPSRHLTIPAGQSVHLAQVTLGETPINRFEATFESDDPADNVLPDNDRAEAFTATPSKGSVLVVDSHAARRPNRLAQLLDAADIPAAVHVPAQLPGDLLSLQNYDLIILDNIAAYELTAHQHQMLGQFVTNLGGGLIMTGGDNSFGAGGWKGTAIADLLPVEVDPPRELRLPSAALVLVLDKSGSMNQGVAGARASQQQVANEGAALAIESLRSDNLVGVVTFDMIAHTLVPLQPNDHPRQLADKVRNITAEGGTNIEAALIHSYEMIKNAQVAKKRVVFLTDGRSGSNEGLRELAQRMAAEDIQLTTIAVGDDADYGILEELARVGGGSFYPVRDPRTLPRVLVDSVQVINKPLIKEISFVPRVLATGSTLTAGLDAAPPLEGLVITGARADAKVTLEMIDPDNEPLLAHWQVGLGRVAAFTSAAPGSSRWSQQWSDWPAAATFWTQLARTISRPAMNRDGELIAVVRDERLHITFDLEARAEVDAPDAGGGNSSSQQYLQVEGAVFRPDGTSTPVRLRQTAPGRYETSLEAPLAGNYIVALNPREGARQLAPAIGGANRSSNPEFRRYSSNAALLDEILQQTGGRTLNLTDAAGANLFDRHGMPPSLSSLPAWRTILWWTLALLLMDVASRRIAWDAILLRSLIGRALARIAPGRVRSAEAAATLATLRRVSDEVEGRRAAQSAGFEQFAGTGRVAPPPDRPEAEVVNDDLWPARGTASFERMDSRQPQPAAPDETKVAAALDALLGRSKPNAEPAVPQAPAPDVGTSAAETTRSLLAAKRRARRDAPPHQPP